MENNKNGSKKNLPVVRQTFMAKKTTTNYVVRNVPKEVTNTA